MAFELSINVEDILENYEEGQMFQEIWFKFGFDPELSELYFMHVGLQRNPGGTELYFNAIVRNVINNTETPFWGGAVKPFGASVEERHIIRGSVNIACQILLERCRPPDVWMVTRDANLPDSALEKFGLLSDVFCGAGYAVLMEEPHHGKKVWRFTLPDFGLESGE